MASGGPAAGRCVMFNSYHEEFADAERMINFVKEKKASGALYNIFGETIKVTPSAGPGSPAGVDVLALLYSFTV